MRRVRSQRRGPRSTAGEPAAVGEIKRHVNPFIGLLTAGLWLQEEEGGGGGELIQAAGGVCARTTALKLNRAGTGAKAGRKLRASGTASRVDTSTPRSKSGRRHLDAKVGQSAVSCPIDILLKIAATACGVGRNVSPFKKEPSGTLQTHPPKDVPTGRTPMFKVEERNTEEWRHVG